MEGLGSMKATQAMRRRRLQKATIFKICLTQCVRAEVPRGHMAQGKSEFKPRGSYIRYHTKTWGKNTSSRFFSIPKGPVPGSGFL